MQELVDDAGSLLLFDLGFARFFQFSEQLVVNFPAHWLLHLTELGAEVLHPTEPPDGIAAMCPLLGAVLIVEGAGTALVLAKTRVRATLKSGEPYDVLRRASFR